MRHFCNKQSDNPNSLACRALGKATNPQASWKPMRYYPNTPFCFKQRSPFARTYLRVVSFFGQTGALLGAKLPRSGKPTAFKLGSLQRPHGRLGPIAFSFPSGRPGHPTETGRLFGCQAWAFAPVIRADAQARPFTVDYKRRTALRARVASPPPPPFPPPPSLFPHPSLRLPQYSPKQDPDRRAARNSNRRESLSHPPIAVFIGARRIARPIKGNGLGNGAPSDASGRCE